MARKPKKQDTKKNGELGFEAKLWAMADALRNNMDAAEYKHVVLGLIFLKYISDAFEAKHAELEAQSRRRRRSGGSGRIPRRRTSSGCRRRRAGPISNRRRRSRPSARWWTMPWRRSSATTPRSRACCRRTSPAPASTSSASASSSISSAISRSARPADRAKDTLGRVYEYFLSRFASAEGKSGGQFYTPSHVVRVLVEMLAPYKGRVYDPCCGSGGMFVQSEKFIEAHAGKLGDISIYGQESNYTTWRLAKMNLAIRGIDAQIGHGDTFHNDRHPDLKADYVLANPPFNDSDWRGDLLKDDKRWVYGMPPAGNANFAWVQHFIYHLAPTGLAGFVLANGSMSSNQSGEGEIRKAIIEADLVDCMVALPGQLFYSTQIPVCLWFLARTASRTAASATGAAKRCSSTRASSAR